MSTLHLAWASSKGFLNYGRLASQRLSITIAQNDDNNHGMRVSLRCQRRQDR